ncbi:MAG: hypothetical protein M3157_00475 [Actinomycetota bacterium]|nr:hypothetical protein [Actinomycetota bacterium]
MYGSRLLHRLDVSLDRLLARRPGLAANTVRYGWALLVALAILLLAVGAVTAGGRSQEIIYATQDGSVVSLEPESGAVTEIYAGGPGGYATAPARTGGSRNISFTVLREDGERLRGDLYKADLVRGTRALTQRAEPGEVFADSALSGDRAWLLASRYSAGAPPNVLVLPASGATERLLEPDLPGAVPVLGPIWGAENTVYAWRLGPNGLTLAAYNFFERRQAAAYETTNRVGTPYYHFDANALIFDERPRGGDLSESRVRLLVGTGELSISGAEGLGLYDPSPVVPELGDALPVMWTDGEKSGVGLISSDGWRFAKTGITVEPGSRSPRVSRDGSYVATTDAGGTQITVRRMEDGSVVRRVEDLQPPGVVLDRMREAGFEPPEEARWFAPTFSWRSLEDG